VTPQTVVDFWFDPANRYGWFRATPAFDAELVRHFEPAVGTALAGGLADWKETAQGALALVILLDQMPLNMYRGEARSFAGEAPAREVALAAIERGFDRELEAERRAFLYLPFMHSESLDDQDRAVALFEAAGLTENLRWARHHREIVHRFGRFPHRNAILGRTSTDAERQWLDSDEGFHG
jgi:uncharacterized protein (DUF924 family)